jgi:slime mold repeat-containing protein
LRLHERFTLLRAGVFTLATLSVASCTAEAPLPSAAAEQEVIAPPLPSNLNLILNAKTSVTVGAFTSVNGDVGGSGPNGSVLFDVSSSQGFGGFNVVANTVTVNTAASVGHVFGNDITVNGFASQQTLGLDPSAMPQVPAVTPAAPGTTNVSTRENQAKQLCPGQYGAISLGVNSTLNLNGGVYQVTRLTLADGARLEPSEPVVILVSGGVTTGIGSAIQPSAQALNPMTAANIRIEVGGAVTLGDSNQIRAHLLVTGKLTAGKSLSMSGAAWARTISIGTNGFVGGDGAFSAQAASVPPPCNDNNACTADACVGGGSTAGFCRNTPAPSGTSCSDGNTCNGAELCDGAGQCQPGTNSPAGTGCPDSDLCNGDETCNGGGSCLPGAPPVVDDNNVCTADACDATAGVIHTPLPDGTTCNGTGVCTAGTCTVTFPSSGSFSYSGFDTNSATQNTFNFDIPMVAGQTLSAGTCGLTGASGSGDTFLRLFDSFNAQVTFNDDACGVLSFFTFTATSTGTYQLRAGCFSSASCSGTVAYVLSGP